MNPEPIITIEKCLSYLDKSPYPLNGDEGMAKDVTHFPFTEYANGVYENIGDKSEAFGKDDYFYYHACRIRLERFGYVFIKTGALASSPEDLFTILSFSQSHAPEKHMSFSNPDFAENPIRVIVPCSDDSFSFVNHYVSKISSVDFHIYKRTESIDIIASRMVKRFCQFTQLRLLHNKNNFSSVTGRYNDDFALNFLTDESIKFKSERSIHPEKKHNGDFIFAQLSYKTEVYNIIRNSQLKIKVGRLKSSPETQIAIINIGESNNVFKYTTLFAYCLSGDIGDFNYSDDNNLIILDSLDGLSAFIKDAIKSLSDLITVESISEKIQYALYQTHSSGHYDGDCNSHKRLLAVSYCKDSLRERFNEHYKHNDKVGELLPNIDELSYRGGTGGGLASSSYTVTIEEFKSFDSPDRESL